MAGSAGNGRIEGVALQEQARWQVRTSSIAETIQELSRIWGVVAQRVASAPSERARCEAEAQGMIPGKAKCSRRALVGGVRAAS